MSQCCGITKDHIFSLRYNPYLIRNCFLCEDVVVYFWILLQTTSGYALQWKWHHVMLMFGRRIYYDSEFLLKHEPLALWNLGKKRTESTITLLIYFTSGVSHRGTTLWEEVSVKFTYFHCDTISLNYQETFFQTDLDYFDITWHLHYKPHIFCTWLCGHISVVLQLHSLLLSESHLFLCSTHSQYHLHFTAYLTQLLRPRYSKSALFFVLIRTPPLRFDSGTVWAGSAEPSPRTPTVLRGLCCLSCAHWRR